MSKHMNQEQSVLKVFGTWALFAGIVIGLIFGSFSLTLGISHLIYSLALSLNFSTQTGEVTSFFAGILTLLASLGMSATLITFLVQTLQKKIWWR